MDTIYNQVTSHSPVSSVEITPEKTRVVLCAVSFFMVIKTKNSPEWKSSSFSHGPDWQQYLRTTRGRELTGYQALHLLHLLLLYYTYTTLTKYTYLTYYT